MLTTILRRLHVFDHAASKAMFTGSESSHKRMRALLVFLEFTGHGIPWFVGIVVGHILFGAVLHNVTLNLLVLLLYDIVVIVLLKATIRRPRPGYNEEDQVGTVELDRNFSFPSGHSTRAALVFTFFALGKRNGVYGLENVPAYHIELVFFWATCVAMSRVMLGRHYVSDVFCGFFIGVAVGFCVFRYGLISYSRSEGIQKWMCSHYLVVC